MRKLLQIILFSATLFCGHLFAQKIERVEIKGGMYLTSEQSILKWMSLKVGDDATVESVKEQISLLMDRGLFESVAIHLEEESGVLVVDVVEKKMITFFEVNGDTILKEKIKSIQKFYKVSRGVMYNEDRLNRLIQTFKDLYTQEGYLQVEVKVDTQKSDTGVRLIIDIVPGKQATVSKIQFDGVHFVSDYNLKRKIPLKQSGFLTWFTKDNAFSEAKLKQSTSAIEQFYRDSGYLQVAVEASFTADDGEYSVVFTIKEGGRARIEGISLVSDQHQNELKSVILLRDKMFFDGVQLRRSIERLQKKAMELGINNAVVEVKQQPGSSNQTVQIVFEMHGEDLGQVRFIHFHGMHKSQDRLFRHALLQQEGDAFSTYKMQRSIRLLKQLPFIRNAAFDRQKISENVYDVHVRVEEMKSGTISGGATFAADSVGLNVDYKESNLLGLGHSLLLSASGGKHFYNFSFAYDYPYAFELPIHQRLTLSSNRVNKKGSSSHLFEIEKNTAALDYTYQLDDYQSISAGIHLSSNKITLSGDAPAFMTKQIDGSGGYNDPIGNHFFVHGLQLGYSYNNLDRYFHPRDGWNLSSSVFFAPEGHHDALSYYQLSAAGKYFHTREWIDDLPVTMRLKANISQGGRLGANNTDLPFFMRYKLGGADSLRGFDDFGIGEKDSGVPLGGNLLTVAKVDLLFPLNFVADGRMSLFVDVGGVYDGGFDSDELRSSAGVSVEIPTPISPIVLGYAYPIKEKSGDSLNKFFFTLSGL